MRATEQDNDAVFAPLATDEDDAVRRLHQKLVSAAEAEAVLDVSYRTVDTPVGALLLAGTERGLVRVAYDREGGEGSESHDEALAMLAEKVSPRILRAPARLDPVARQLEEYFAGTRRTFDVPLDLRLAHGFRLGVLEHLPDIGYGHTESYAQVAAAVGNPGAVRAAGTACARNPLPVVVPCHRVVRSDGSLGRYAGGPEAKRVLLRMEGAAA